MFDYDMIDGLMDQGSTNFHRKCTMNVNVSFPPAMSIHDDLLMKVERCG